MSIASGSAAQNDEYRLPRAHDFHSAPMSPADIPTAIRGLPLSLDGISTSCIAGRTVLYIPVLMHEPEVPIDLETLTVDPMDWDEQRVVSRELGRRSLYFVEPGRSMLYGVLIDAGDMSPTAVGVGLVVVHRLNDEAYDVVIQSNRGEVLAAARGRVEAIDPAVGHGRMLAVPSQSDVRRRYETAWDLDPSDLCFPLFGG